MREFERADLDHSYTLKKFECAVIFGYIDPIDKTEFDELEYDNEIDGEQLHHGRLSGLWDQLKGSLLSGQFTLSTRVKTSKRESLRIQAQIGKLKSGSWLVNNEDILRQIKEIVKVEKGQVTREIIEKYEMKKQEMKYENWVLDNPEKSNRVDQIFNLYGSRPDYELFRTRLIEKGILTFDSKVSRNQKIVRYMYKWWCSWFSTPGTMDPDDSDLVTIYDKIYMLLKYGWIENDERRKEAFEEIGINDEETIKEIEKTYHEVICIRYVDWIKMLDFENDLETIISNTHASMHVVIFPSIALNLILFGGYVFEMASDSDYPKYYAATVLACWCLFLPLICKQFFYAYRSLLKNRMIINKEITFKDFIIEVVLRTIAGIRSRLSWNRNSRKNSSDNVDATTGAPTVDSERKDDGSNGVDRGYERKNMHDRMVEMGPTIGNPLIHSSA